MHNNNNYKSINNGESTKTTSKPRTHFETKTKVSRRQADGESAVCVSLCVYMFVSI